MAPAAATERNLLFPFETSDSFVDSSTSAVSEVALYSSSFVLLILLPTIF